MRRPVRAFLAALVAVAVGAGDGSGQASSGFRDTVTVVPGPGYAKGGVYRFFFGTRYRQLWTSPVRVPRLDLATYGGGLRPLKRGGGQQTKSLRFVGADGRQYAFRSVDKDPTVVLPEDLRETFADRVFQDQISAGHPAGALIVGPILTAAGILHAEPTMVVMPDDPALGDYRAEFAGVLGLLEERPRDDDEEGVSFAGARDVVSTEELFDRLDERPAERVDARQFLLARLTDVFLGDWDRHRDQWRWALLDAGGPRWVPIPRDRDQAFVRFDGFLLGVIRQQVPQLVNFGPEYPPIVGATWNGRDLDRRFLPELERPVWDSVAAVLETRITDQVLEEAVARLPAEMRQTDGPRLLSALQTRRSGLRAMAGRYYEMLAAEVDVTGSDQAELAVVERVDAGVIEVTVGPRAGGAPFFRRRFHAGETREVRLYLKGGADSAAVIGTGNAPIIVRAIGGGGDDRFVDQASLGRTRFYDTRGDNRAVGRSIDTREYRAIDDTTNPRALPHRDWGAKHLSYPVASLGPDVGLVVGWGGRFTHWAFRKKPNAWVLRYTASIATGAATGRLDIAARHQRENSRNYFAIEALGSGIEVLRWYGFGNETTVDETRPISHYRVTQHQVALAPSLGWVLGERTVLQFGPRFKYSVTELDDGQNADRFIGTDRPFGTGGFAQLGGGIGFSHDSRDVPSAAKRGVLLELGGSWYPEALDVERSFGEVHGRFATYLSARMPTSPTLALQVGAKKVFGESGAIPFHEAAVLGSTGTLRGYRTHRFAGDAALFGSAELRLHLTNLFLAVPGKQGIFGFADQGRVYLEGENSNTWHRSYGAGVWLAFLTPGSLVTAGLGHSEEGNRLFARVGFAF